MVYLWIAAGGAVGALLRFGVAAAVNERFGPSPLGIFVVNISGAFVIGLLAGITADWEQVPAPLRYFGTIGVLGGYTTFSTLMLDTIALIESRELLRAFANGLGSLAVGLLAVWLGLLIGRAV
jgi:fluoride exporter